VSENNLAVLRDKITAHFNRAELMAVLHDLGVDHENIAGNSLNMLSLNTVQYFKNRTMVVDLATALAKQKPSVDFSYWGSPEPVESLRGVLRQLLNEAFNLSELKTLVFSVFPELSDELGHKSHAVERIIDHALKQNRVLPMMEFVRGCNSSQYSAYVMRVDRALQAYKNQDPALIPEVPVFKKPPPRATTALNDAVLLAAKMYANGHNDGGKMMKSALGMAGIDY